MLKQCSNRVPPCIDNLTGLAGDPDSPFRNLSSEAPEVGKYYRTTFGNRNDDDPTRFYAEGCKTLCVSEISQEEANLCAERQVFLCVNDNDGGGGGGNNPDPWDPPSDNPPGGNNPGGGNPGVVPPGSGTPGGGGGTPTTPGGSNPGGGNNLFYSATADCSVSCLDGSQFTKTVEAGKFIDITQARADAKAREYVCNQAKLAKVCLGDLTGLDVICLWSEVEGSISATGANAPYTMTVAGGGLPSGLVSSSNEAGTILTISGVPNSPGTYDFSVRAEDANGNFNTRDYSIRVIGVTEQPGPLMDGLINRNYTHQFFADGMVAPLSWLATGLPPGMSMNAATGLISGPPTDNGAYAISVLVEDAEGTICGAHPYDLYIFDCTEEFNGGFSTELACTGGSTSFTIPPAWCDRVLACTVPLMPPICPQGAGFCNPDGWTIASFEFFKPDGSPHASHTCANRAPFAFQIPGLHVTIPAQLLDEDPLPYTCIMKVENTASSIGDDCTGSVPFLLEGF